MLPCHLTKTMQDEDHCSFVLQRWGKSHVKFQVVAPYLGPVCNYFPVLGFIYFSCDIFAVPQIHAIILLCTDGIWQLQV